MPKGQRPFHQMDGGMTLVEVVLAMALVTVFSASALSAYMMNQTYATLSIYNSHANRINQRQAEILLVTNYHHITSDSLISYDHMVTPASTGDDFSEVENRYSPKEFTSRPGHQWTTNLAAIVAYETVTDVRDKVSYKEIELHTYWNFNGKYMTNSLTVARAKDSL